MVVYASSASLDMSDYIGSARRPGDQGSLGIREKTMIAAKKPLSVLFTCAIVASATATGYCVATTGASRDDVVVKSDGAYRTIRMAAEVPDIRLFRSGLRAEFPRGDTREVRDRPRPRARGEGSDVHRLLHLLGRGDGEAYQIGFVDVCDRPYPELCRSARMVGETMYRKRSKGVW